MKFFYSLNEPPPPYPGDPNPIENPDNPGAMNNNEDNNNGDINGNSDLRDQHSERVVAVLRLSPPLRRTMRGGSSLVALNQHPRGGPHQGGSILPQQPLRGSRSVAALSTSPSHSRSGHGPPIASGVAQVGGHHGHRGGASRGGLAYPPSSGSSSSFTD